MIVQSTFVLSRQQERRTWHFRLIKIILIQCKIHEDLYFFFMKLSSAHKMLEIFFRSGPKKERDSFLIRIRNNLMHEHEGKKERGNGTAKGARNCSQGCIAEVEREGPRGDHEGGRKADGLCVRGALHRQRCTEGKARMYRCVRSCAGVSDRVCNTEETRI